MCVPVEDRRGSSRLSIDDIGLLSREKPDCRFFLFLLCYILFILTAEHPSYYVSFMGAGAVTVGYSESGGLVSNMTFKHEGIITRRLSDRVNSLEYHPITVRIKLGVELMEMMDDCAIYIGSFFM